eukprot:COSAG02_NODE_6504_length_3534_cov_1.715575_2_plen_107_part_00
MDRQLRAKIQFSMGEPHYRARVPSTVSHATLLYHGLLRCCARYRLGGAHWPQQQQKQLWLLDLELARRHTHTQTCTLRSVVCLWRGECGVRYRWCAARTAAGDALC